MLYKKMGRTGLRVSTFCLGTMNFGSQVDEKGAIQIMERALEVGVNFIDTADVYAKGRSEEIVGKILKEKRDSIVVATKVSAKVGEGANDRGLSRKHIIKGIEDSLRRLQTDYIDIYYAHMPDIDTPLEETLRAMQDLVYQGKVRYIACSNYTAWQLCKALWASDKQNMTRFECVSPPYNLVTRDIESELLPLCSSEGIGVCVYNPLAAGILTGKHDSKSPPAEGGRFTLEGMGKNYYNRYWNEVNFNAVELLRKIASEHGRSLAQFSLAWVFNNEGVTATICGASSLVQLEQNLEATEILLSKEELIDCDDVWQQIRPPRFFYGR
jgi:aryl-alcohol dehydrogenase-like predicted oxidoreductase